MHFQSVCQKKGNIHNKTNKYRWHFRSKPHQTTSLNDIHQCCYNKKVDRWPMAHNDPVRTIGLVLGPCTALYRSFLKRCTLTRRLGLYDGPCLNLLRDDRSWSPSPLILSRDSFSLWTRARVQTARSTAYFNGCPYIFLNDILFYITIYVCVPHFYDLSALVGCWSSVYIRRIIYKFLNVCPFDYTAVAVSGKVERS